MRVAATSEKARQVMVLLTQIQKQFVQQLITMSTQAGKPNAFEKVEWLRDKGEHGGGLRYQLAVTGLFSRASVNVSQVHFEYSDDKKFTVATALSTIIHPAHPCLPSLHLHISWTLLKNGQSYWRIMADLNPAIVDLSDKQTFDNALRVAAAEYYAQGCALGEQYFNIPALAVHRGVSHFYLEGFNPDCAEFLAFPSNFAETMINAYTEIISDKSKRVKAKTKEQVNTQLAYHTLYFYQVLTLDRGTTAGLLAHDQNDLGTLGSLPAYISRDLLSRWIAKTVAPKDKLITDLLAIFPNTNRCAVTEKEKRQIAKIIRDFYKIHR
jgi:coproporphyrinogen III oxidase